jgi:hypothetical protein
MSVDYLSGVIQQFEYYKLLGEKTIDQLNDEQLNWSYNSESNSIAVIVQHLYGNMLSRWTNFFTEDGEKTWRNRDAEFESKLLTKKELLELWNKGWQCLLDVLKSLKPADLSKTVYIRNQGHTVTEAIHRQLAHYPYHVGQMVFIGKMIRGANWNNLSIPKGQSETYNADKFSKPQHKAHFTDEYVTKSSSDKKRTS